MILFVKYWIKSIQKDLVSSSMQSSGVVVPQVFSMNLVLVRVVMVVHCEGIPSF